jgi:hypothetical protein
MDRFRSDEDFLFTDDEINNTIDIDADDSLDDKDDNTDNKIWFFDNEK